MLDEALEIIRGLWTGSPFGFEGRHYHVEAAAFRPVPVQRSRIPIWVAGMWPYHRPFRRAARFDGVFPIKAGEDMPMLEPSELGQVISYVARHRKDNGPYDIVTYADLRGDARRAAALVEAWSEAGATWLHVGPGDFGMEPVESFRARVRAGPPGL